jgi:cytoskeletal protein RodZ
MDDGTEHQKSASRLGPAGWITLIVLAGFLAVSIWYAARVWNAMSGVHMSGFGWTFLVLGVVVTFALGAGLMALVFYSSRHDMDR